MKVIITVNEAIDKGFWYDLCNLKGINAWSLNEGLMDDTQEIILTEEETKELGIIERGKHEETDNNR